jgi:hypothetical protein
MMTKNKEKEDNHGDCNQEKWFAFTYCGKEVKYITKLFKGAHVKIAYRISNTMGKILTYHNMSKINKFNRSDIYQLLGVQIAGGNALHKLADYSAKAVMNIFFLSNIKIQIQHLQNTYMILDIYLALLNVS